MNTCRRNRVMLVCIQFYTHLIQCSYFHVIVRNMRVVKMCHCCSNWSNHLDCQRHSIPTGIKRNDVIFEFARASYMFMNYKSLLILFVHDFRIIYLSLHEFPGLIVGFVILEHVIETVVPEGTHIIWFKRAENDQLELRQQNNEDYNGRLPKI